MIMPKIPKSKRPFWTKAAKTKQPPKKSRNQDFYNSTEWRKLRAKKFSMTPLCEACEKLGLVVVGTQIDHIQSISTGGAPLCLSNLQTLCYSCHGRKSAKEQKAEKMNISLTFERGII